MKKSTCLLLALFMICSLFSPVYAKMGEVMDHFYSLKFSDRYNDWNAYYHIPEIITGQDLDTTYAEGIYNFYNDIYEEARSAQKKNAEPDCGNISYVCGENNDIFSLVVRRQYMLYDDYYLDVYNMDKTIGTQLSDSAVVKKFGYTPDTFMAKVISVLPDVFDELNRGAYPAVSQKEIEIALDYTLSKDALDWVKPYVNEDGELCFTAWIGSFAGSGAYLHRINLEHGKYEGDIPYTGKKYSSYPITTPKDESEKPSEPPYSGYRPHGDVNYDGTLDAKDATQILRYINGKSSVFTNQSGEELKKTTDVSDINRDKSIDAKDATQILRKINGKTSIFDSIA